MSSGGSLRLWDPSGPEPRPLGEPIQTPGSVISVAFSPSGDRLATASNVGLGLYRGARGLDDGTLRLWDLSGPEPRPVGEPIPTGQGLVFSVAFSPLGDRLATGGEGGTLRLFGPPYWPVYWQGFDDLKATAEHWLR